MVLRLASALPLVAALLFSSPAAAAPPPLAAPSAPRVSVPARPATAPAAEVAPKIPRLATGTPKVILGTASEGFQTPPGPALDAPEQRIHQALGVPTPRAESYPHATVVSRQGFVSVYDTERKIPLVVSWATTPKDLGPSREAWGEREDVFHEDSLLHAPQASLADYRGSGFHRGHMVRQGERPISLNRPANQSTFSMVNILPQSPNNNVGPWGHFEDFYRDQVFETKKVAYIQAGPILEGPPRTIGTGGVAVPSHTYKIVVLADEGLDLKTVKPEEIGTKVKVFAVIIPNNDRDVRLGDHWAKFIVPVSQVAKRTGHPGFIAGFSEETRKAAWNHRPEAVPLQTPAGLSYKVDGVDAKPWAPKVDRNAKRTAQEKGPRRS
jgi:endonuclease G